MDPYSSTSMDEYNMAYDKTAPGDPYAGHNAMQDPYQQYGETDAYGNSYGYVDEYGNPQPDSGNVYASYNHTGKDFNYMPGENPKSDVKLFIELETVRIHL